MEDASPADSRLDDAALGDEDTAVEGAHSGSGAKVISLHTRRLPPDPRTTLPDMSNTTGC